MARSNLCLQTPRMVVTSGEYVASRMKAKKNREKVTQKELASAMGISQPALSQKLRNSQFSFEDFQTISNVLGFSDDEIVLLVRKGRK